MQKFDVWEPRYHDKIVLLKDSKIAPHNKIVFTKSNSMGELPYYISGQKAKSYKTEMMDTRNGDKVKMRAVPQSALQLLVLADVCEHLYR